MGSWEASPPRDSFDWASPIPRRRPSAVTENGGVDFDLVIDLDERPSTIQKDEF